MQTKVNSPINPPERQVRLVGLPPDAPLVMPKQMLERSEPLGRAIVRFILSRLHIGASPRRGM